MPEEFLKKFKKNAEGILQKKIRSNFQRNFKGNG